MKQTKYRPYRGIISRFMCGEVVKEEERDAIRTFFYHYIEEYAEDLIEGPDGNMMPADGFWTTADGRVLLIENMETRHINNVLAMLKRKGLVSYYLKAVRNMQQELDDRHAKENFQSMDDIKNRINFMKNNDDW